MKSREFFGISALLCFWLFLWFHGTGQAYESLSKYYGKTISRIDFQVESPFNIPYLELENLVGLSAGDALSREKLRVAIKALASKDVFRNIEVYGREEGGKVALLFRLFPEVLVSSVTFQGVGHFDEEKLLGELGIKIGEVADVRLLKAAREKVKNLYDKHGYFDASVSVIGACSAEEGTVEIRIRVNEGPPPVLSKVEVTGEGVEVDVVKEILDLVEGEIVDFGRVERRLKKLRKHYQKRGYLTVRVKNLSLSKTVKGVVLRLNVEKGPKYEIVFRGNGEFSGGRLIRAAGIVDGEERTEREVVSLLESRLRDFYEEEGYPFARINVKVAGERVIAVEISEGPRGIIKDITFKGNSSIPEDELEARMETETRKFYSFLTGGGIFHERVISRDLENLRGFYQSRGFPNARLFLESADVKDDEGLRLVIDVDEGNRYVLSEVSFEGVTFFTKGELLRHVTNRVGDPVDYLAAYADAYSIQREYLNNGFDDCRVGVKFVVVGEHEIKLVYKVDEGKRFRFGKLLVQGNRNVSSEVVLREFPLERGDFMNEDALIQFQRSLYRTRLFKRVRLKKVKNHDAGIANVVVYVTEADFFTAEVGVGYGTDTGYRFSLGVINRNINGLGRSLEGKLSLSEREKKVITTVREPWLFGFDLEGVGSVSYQEVREKSFSFESYSVSASVTKELFDKSLFSVQVEFNDERKKEVSAGAVISPEDVSLNRSVIIRPVLVLDLRDDSFNPRKGYFYNLNGEFSSGYIASELDYLKFSGQASGYFPVSRKFIFALSGRGGIIESLTREEVPIDRRFFLGGRSTVRGFEESELGPKGDDGSPIGGDTMVVLNAELRYYFYGNFVLGIFTDVGSLWIRGDERYPFELRETAGFSLKYLTPVGPVSFDMGFKLDKKPNEPLSAWHFTVGLVF